ncbi:MAG TPA: DUF1080 domain-containing protein [Chloroflexota bacterium]|nr:DUF1080 domain-containing protein [Chloroflexota bacterium]
MSEWVELFNGQNLDGWTARKEHRWRVAGGVRLHPESERRFQIEPGTGIFLNGDEGRTEDLHTVMEHGSCELYLEFCVPAGSNSGVYLMGQYEIQILDSWGTPDAELKYGSCGGIYARWVAETRTAYDGQAPRTNASKAPGEWQSFEIVFRAPEFDDTGKKVGNARFERILHNGVVIHENFECSGPTRGAWQEQDIARGPLRLQGDHGPVAFRNVRLRHLD